MAADGPNREPDFRKKSVLLVIWIALCAAMLLGVLRLESPRFGPAQSILTVRTGFGMNDRELLTEPIDINTASLTEVSALSLNEMQHVF